VTKRSRDEADAAADLGDEVRDYIARLTSEKSEEGQKLYKAEQRHQIMADRAAATKSQMRTKDNQVSALTTQVATLTRSIETLMKTITCMPAMQAGGEKDNKRREGRREKKGYTSSRNIRGYCWSHGWDPVGDKHNSRYCTRMRDGHKVEATGDNKMGDPPGNLNTATTTNCN